MSNLENYDLLASAIVLLDGQGKVVYANSAAQELFGLSQRQLLGVGAESLFGADAMLEPRFLDAVHGKYGVLRQNAAARHLNTDIPVSLAIVPLEGQPWSALLEIRTLDQHLDRAQQLDKELTVQRESLRNLAHEIKNPLGGIRGAAQLLEAELQAGPLCEYTGVIIAEADRLTALIDRLIAPQKQALSKSLFNIHEICERVYTLLRAEFAGQLELVRDYDASVPELQGDAARLLQALLNIGRNAAQALAEAGAATVAPKLVLRTRIGRQMALATGSARMAVVVSVIDNGPGVPQELHDKIFHPLVTGRANGTGLGLSLAQEFVQQHGGVIEFESRAGFTEFRLILPLELA